MHVNLFNNEQSASAKTQTQKRSLKGNTVSNNDNFVNCGHWRSQRSTDSLSINGYWWHIRIVVRGSRLIGWCL